MCYVVVSSYGIYFQFKGLTMANLCASFLCSEGIFAYVTDDAEFVTSRFMPFPFALRYLLNIDAWHPALGDEVQNSVPAPRCDEISPGEDLGGEDEAQDPPDYDRGLTELSGMPRPQPWDGR